MRAERAQSGAVTLTMTYSGAIALRKAVSFADFDDGLPARDPAEAAIVSRLLSSLDPVIPELGSDAYGSVVAAARREINEPD